ncbi:hypothetical protein HD554DRAFT_2038579 [Boletus coccyginus]|nr:hypothetical protein HD554DRAFT_2038579 [Boletus coccyginus]
MLPGDNISGTEDHRGPANRPIILCHHAVPPLAYRPEDLPLDLLTALKELSSITDHDPALPANVRSIVTASTSISLPALSRSVPDVTDRAGRLLAVWGWRQCLRKWLISSAHNAVGQCPGCTQICQGCTKLEALASDRVIIPMLRLVLNSLDTRPGPCFSPLVRLTPRLKLQITKDIYDVECAVGGVAPVRPSREGTRPTLFGPRFLQLSHAVKLLSYAACVWVWEPSRVFSKLDATSTAHEGYLLFFSFKPHQDTKGFLVDSPDLPITGSVCGRRTIYIPFPTTVFAGGEDMTPDISGSGAPTLIRRRLGSLAFLPRRPWMQPK